MEWKFIQNKGSLLHSTLALKYGNGVDDAVRLKGGSLSWKIITEGGKFLNSVVRWDVSVGKSIDVYKDLWIWDKCIDKWHTFVAILESEGLTVDKLLVDGFWDVDKLCRFFGLELIEHI